MMMRFAVALGRSSFACASLLLLIGAQAAGGDLVWVQEAVVKANSQKLLACAKSAVRANPSVGLIDAEPLQNTVVMFAINSDLFAIPVQGQIHSISQAEAGIKMIAGKDFDPESLVVMHKIVAELSASIEACAAGTKDSPH